MLRWLMELLGMPKRKNVNYLHESPNRYYFFDVNDKLTVINKKTMMREMEEENVYGM